jgi:hypothetical protein
MDVLLKMYVTFARFVLNPVTIEKHVPRIWNYYYLALTVCPHDSLNVENYTRNLTIASVTCSHSSVGIAT